MKANRETRIGIPGIVATVLALGVVPAAALTPCGVEEISWTAHGQNFDPSQTHAPGGPSRPVSEDRVAVRWWPDRGQAELRWQLGTHYPFAADFEYLEQLSLEDSVVTGVDGFRAREDSLPPARRAARFADLWLRAPLLWTGEEGGRSREISLAGTRWTLSVARDAAMGGDSVPLVARARVRNPPGGTVEQRVAYADWRDVEGLSMPTRVEVRLDGKLLRRERLGDIRVRRAEVVSEDCEPPLRPESAEAPVWVRGLTHWVTRRLAMGAGAEADQTDNVALEPLGEGIFHVVGGSHHALLIVDEAQLSLVGAPLHPGRSEKLLRELGERWPDRPLTRVVVTHHHNDHSAGLRPLLGEGVTLYVGAEAEAFFAEALADFPDDAGFSMQAVGARERLDETERSLTLINIPNDHAAGMLAVRVDDAGLTYVSDLYSPGRDVQNPLLARQFLRALEWHGLASGTLVGAHGSGTEPVSALVEWVRAQQESAD
ncbi:MBL fold metallo-hydrolase [Algiphilus aromaticivorans]|uniref:MBL fold metallo-hydrolase n=1 Tax=Algiphilus aromaticivorans TaxID=382454 RepID=UPI0005C19540|nr:MBL fold metallo-hydrolase [Algiphilus aromaticivorans]